MLSYLLNHKAAPAEENGTFLHGCGIVFISVRKRQGMRIAAPVCELARNDKIGRFQPRAGGQWLPLRIVILSEAKNPRPPSPVACCLGRAAIGRPYGVT